MPNPLPATVRWSRPAGAGYWHAFDPDAQRGPVLEALELDRDPFSACGIHRRSADDQALELGAVLERGARACPVCCWILTGEREPQLALAVDAGRGPGGDRPELAGGPPPVDRSSPSPVG